MSRTELYDRLAVKPDATHEEIRDAYRRKAKIAHPDHGGHVDLFMSIDEAWKILGDPEARAAYDESGTIPGKEVIDQERRMILEIITQCFSSMLEAKAYKDGRKNLTLAMADEISENIVRFENQIDAAKNEIADLVKLKKRIFPKDPKRIDNVFSKIIEHRIERIEARIAGIEVDIRRGTMAREEILLYDTAVEVMQYLSAWPSTSVSGSWFDTTVT